MSVPNWSQLTPKKNNEILLEINVLQKFTTHALFSNWKCWFLSFRQYRFYEPFFSLQQMASALNVFLLFCEKNSAEDMLLFGGSISSIHRKYLEVDFGSVVFEGLINAIWHILNH